MTSPAPSPAPSLGLSESVRAVFAELEEDPKLAGKGLSAAFATSFPDLPTEATTLADWAACSSDPRRAGQPGLSSVSPWETASRPSLPVFCLVFLKPTISL